MAFRHVFNQTAIVLLASLGAVGCQHDSAPLHMSVASEELARPDSLEQHPSDPRDRPYVNPSWVEEDPPEPLNVAALHTTTWLVSATFGPVVDATERAIARLNGDKPSAADRLLEDTTHPDNRREGMNKLIDFGYLDNPIFVKRCREIAQHDNDFTVRATAIRTGNRARDEKGTSIFIKGLSDKNEWVRLESAKALANVPDVAAAEALTILLNTDESKDVRVAAADALKHYRTLSTARVLCDALAERNFVISWQARQSLRYLTGRDFGYNERAWLQYFTGPEKPLG